MEIVECIIEIIKILYYTSITITIENVYILLYFITHFS